MSVLTIGRLKRKGRKCTRSGSIECQQFSDNDFPTWQLQRMIYPRWIYWLVLLLPALVACAPVTRSEQPARPDLVSLGARQSVGQSFLSRYDGLAAVEVYLDPQDQIQGNLFFHLKEDSKSQQDIRTVSLPMAGITRPGFHRFEFQPIPDSGLKSYYFFLHSDSRDGIKVGTAGEDSYLSGAQYLNDLAVNAQTSFRLVYHPVPLLQGLLFEGLSWFFYLLAGLFLFILPGWAILSWCSPGWDSNTWAVKFTWSIGVSLPIYPVLFLWTDIIGVHPGAAYAWLPPLSAIVAIIIRYRSHLLSRIMAMRKEPLRFYPASLPASLPIADLAFLLLAGGLFLLRFWPVRTLPAPMWGDSYQHTMISQLLVDNQGLFRSWQPYADLLSFTYHFGFHSLVAVFHWVTGLSLAQATLWTGQIINALAVLVLYPLAARLGRSPWAGVFAVLLAGSLSQMPMFYTNWGRYTQLAGQAILPAAVLIAWDIFEKPRSGWRPYLLAWVVFAGLALTHYRILIFAVLFFVAYFILNYRRMEVFEFMRAAFLQAAGAGLLFLPWFVRVFGGKLPLIFRAQLTTPASQISAFTEQYNSIGNLFTYLPAFLWLLLPVALAFGFWRRERSLALVSLWWFLIFLSANPQWFNLPGSGAISNFAVLIAAYIPVSLILGSAGGWAMETIDSSQTGHESDSLDNRPFREFFFRWSQIIVLLAVLLASLWGARLRLREVQPAEFALVTWPDEHAAAWIRENVPEDARFLVNSFFAYGETSIVGSDAGWWLPLLTGHATSLPPLTYTSESGPRPDYREWVNDLTAEIMAKGIDHPDVLESLQSRNITHVYIGQQQGTVNNPVPLLIPKIMLASPHFTPIYHQDRVWIFKVNQTSK